MIIITGSAVGKPEVIDRMIALGCEHSARSREEHGCIAHNCYLDAEDPARVHFFEKWADGNAVNQHFALEASQEFVRQMTQLSTSAPQIEMFRAQPADTGAL